MSSSMDLQWDCALLWLLCLIKLFEHLIAIYSDKNMSSSWRRHTPCTKCQQDKSLCILSSPSWVSSGCIRCYKRGFVICMFHHKQEGTYSHSSMKAKCSRDSVGRGESKNDWLCYSIVMIYQQVIRWNHKWCRTWRWWNRWEWPFYPLVFKVVLFFYAKYSFTEISLHPILGFLVKSNFNCKGRRILFELDHVSFKVAAHAHKKCLPYVKDTNCVFLTAKKFSLLIQVQCPELPGMFEVWQCARFKLGVVQGIYYNIILESGVLDNVLILMLDGDSVFSRQSIVRHDLVLGIKDCHFLCFLKANYRTRYD